jgi:hypothetical protein
MRKWVMLILMIILYFSLVLILLTLEDVFHDIDSRSDLFKEEEDDMNQVRSEFDLKIYVD